MSSLTIEELREELAGYCGTSQYFQHLTGTKYTDGIKAMAEKAGAYWLIDAICSYQVEKKIRDIPFQIWKLRVLRAELGKSKAQPMAVLEMNEDTGQPLKVEQKIQYTDFPEGEIKFYLQNGVLFLPSEY